MIKQYLGNGSYGTVYQIEINDKLFALKEVPSIL
jgi:hypothetical protein